MKSIKAFFVLSILFVSMTATSQNLILGAAYSTNDTRIMEGNLYGVTKSGLVLGVGGSHATKTFFTSAKWNGADFSDRNDSKANNFPDLTDPANQKHLRHIMVEDRGTVTGSVGYNFKNSPTIILMDAGIVFQQKIFLGNSANYPVNAENGWYYETRTVGPKFLIGGTVVQNIKGRVGVMVGYNNVQKFRFGITYRITPTKMFKG